jgi:hypothetical protein
MNVTATVSFPGLEAKLKQLSQESDSLTFAVAEMVAAELLREGQNVSLVLLNQAQATEGPFLDYVSRKHPELEKEAEAFLASTELRIPARMQDYIRTHITPNVHETPINATRKGMTYRPKGSGIKHGSRS